MNEHEGKKLSEGRLAGIRRRHEDVPAVRELLGHIDYLADELTVHRQYYEEVLIPDLEQAGREADFSWRRRLEASEARGRRPNPLGLPPGR